MHLHKDHSDKSLKRRCYITSGTSAPSRHAGILLCAGKALLHVHVPLRIHSSWLDCSWWGNSLPLTCALPLGQRSHKPSTATKYSEVSDTDSRLIKASLIIQVFSTAGVLLTSLACWALTGSAYCNRAWNWLFFVNVIIFKTVPNLEKICKIIFAYLIISFTAS